MKAMKFVFLTLFLMLFSISGKSQELFRIVNDKIVATDYYSMYYDNDSNHDPKNYVVYDDSCSFATSNYHYTVKALQNKFSEYYESWGDSLFTKLEIDCFDATDKKVKRYEFINDNEWSRFNYWPFAILTDYEWEGKGREICRIIPLDSNCTAITLRGFRDAIDVEELTIFVVYKDQVQLVYHKNIQINKMIDTPTGVKYELMTVDYDEEENFVFENYRMDFGQGKITLKKEG
jgi:hypothetical protein